MGTLIGPMAQAQEAQSQTDLKDFSGGYVAVTKGVRGLGQLKPNESPLMYNVDTSQGTVRKMRGFTKVTTTGVSADIHTIWHDVADGTTYVGYGTAIGKITGTTVTALTGVPAQTAGSIPIFARLGDHVYWVNGTDTLQRWTPGTSAYAAVATNTPPAWTSSNRPKHLISFQQRLFAWTDDILYWCQLGDGTDWTYATPSVAADGGENPIGDDQRPIRAMVPMAGMMLIFKDRGLYTINATTFTDQTSWSFDLLNDDVGAHSGRSVIAANGLVFALGPGGKLWEIDSSNKLVRIDTNDKSDNVTQELALITTNQSLITSAEYPEKRQVWFAVSQGGSSKIDTVYCYDYLNNAWMVRNGYQHKCIANIDQTDGTRDIYSGGYSANSYIFNQNSGVDYDGSPVSWLYTTYFEEISGMSRGRPIRAIIGLGASTNQPLQYSYCYDRQMTTPYDTMALNSSGAGSTWNTSGGATWGTGGGATGVWGPGSAGYEAREVFGEGRCIQHQFSGNGAGQDFELYSIQHINANKGIQ